MSLWEKIKCRLCCYSRCSIGENGEEEVDMRYKYKKKVHG